MTTTTIRSPLTERQADVLDYILDSIRRRHFSPSYREISRHFGISLSSVVAHLKALQRKGYIESAAGTARAITPTALARLGCSEAEHAVLVAAARLSLTLGRTPELGELIETLDLDEPTVLEQLHRLQDLGYIVWDPTSRRCLRFSPPAWLILFGVE
ncbi:MAG: MarR family transcriptional regulator [Pirellulaceae bacterium]